MFPPFFLLVYQMIHPPLAYSFSLISPLLPSTLLPLYLSIHYQPSDAAKLVAKTRGQLENTWIDKNRNPLNEAFAFMRYTLVRTMNH